jgi:hypothetical protein
MHIRLVGDQSPALCLIYRSLRLNARIECGRLEKGQEHQSAEQAGTVRNCTHGVQISWRDWTELTSYLRLGLYMQTSVLHRLFKSTSEQEFTVLYRTREQRLSSSEIRVFRQPMCRWPDEHHFSRKHAGVPHSAPLLRAPITLWCLTRIIFVSMGHFRLDHLFIRLYLSALSFPVFLHALLVEHSGDRLSCSSGIQISAEAIWLVYRPEHYSRLTGLNSGQLGQSGS